MSFVSYEHFALLIILKNIWFFRLLWSCEYESAEAYLYLKLCTPYVSYPLIRTRIPIYDWTFCEIVNGFGTALMRSYLEKLSNLIKPCKAQRKSSYSLSVYDEFEPQLAVNVFSRKSSVIDVSQGSRYTCIQCLNRRSVLAKNLFLHICPM